MGDTLLSALASGTHRFCSRGALPRKGSQAVYATSRVRDLFRDDNIKGWWGEGQSNSSGIRQSGGAGAGQFPGQVPSVQLTAYPALAQDTQRTKQRTLQPWRYVAASRAHARCSTRVAACHTNNETKNHSRNNQTPHTPSKQRIRRITGILTATI